MNDTPPAADSFGISRRRFLASAATLGGGLLLGKAAWHEPRTFILEERQLHLAKIPPGPGLRIVHLSDLHLRSLPRTFATAVETINKLRPDLILLTGDYLDQARQLEGAIQFIRKLSAAQGIFAIQGNWEYWARLEGEPLRRGLAAAGAELLIDERRDLLIRGIPVSILGIDYPSASHNLETVSRLATRGRVNIALSHVPAFSHNKLAGLADLILSGHTHGGQVRLPYVQPFYLPRFSLPYISGLYRVTEKHIPLYVNRGMGTSLLPVRFLCPPEITLLTLGNPPGAELPWRRPPRDTSGDRSGSVEHR